jgi:signal transduction histidine kinase
VDLAAFVRGLAKDCEQKLVESGIALEMQLPPESVPAVRGNSARLRFVLEHLMNNAEQAIALARMIDSREKVKTVRRDAIRLTASYEEGRVRLIVSDTGTGFSEPERVFDPFYTTQGLAEGNGLGLSLCYGIVREHGGEISAFNLHPAGAAVVVELPVAEVVRSEQHNIGDVARNSAA